MCNRYSKRCAFKPDVFVLDLCVSSERVLGVVHSQGLHNPGPVRWPLALCLLAAWVIIFLCMLKGIRSSGKVSNKVRFVRSHKMHTYSLQECPNIRLLCVCRWFMSQLPSHTWFLLF